MKTLTKSTLLLLIILFAFSANAQLNISGDIQNWPNGEAIVVSSDMISGDMEIWGKVSSAGEVSIDLEYDFLTLLKEKALQAQKNAPQGWTLNFKTVESSFGCQTSDMEGSKPFEYKSAEATISGLPELIVGNNDKSEPYGVLYFSNNEVIANWLHSYGQEKASTGYYLSWMFVEKEASVKGSCVVPTMTMSGQEYNDITITDLQFEEGWNMVKYEFSEVFTASDGMIYPSKTTVSLVKFIPEDLQWIVLPY
jgi:hypothetical protein